MEGETYEDWGCLGEGVELVGAAVCCYAEARCERVSWVSAGTDTTLWRGMAGLESLGG